ncbi:MAG: response regulator [Gemmatimonadota bacterium]|nr:response regulator [Gemmatimonadota bacterium]
MSVVRDLTERVERARQVRFQAALLERVGQPVLAVDEDGRLTYWNRAAEELTGFSWAEIEGGPLVDVLVVEEDRARAVEASERGRAGKRWEGELRLRKKDGGVLVVQTSATPAVNPDGSPGGRIFSGVDISERITLEERLRQAEKMEAIGRLAAGVAHDFNNLLTAIEGHASFLLEEIDEESPLQEDVNEIRDSGRRAADLTRQLLAFSRKQALQERNIELGSAARELNTMLRRLVPERIDLEVRVETEDVVVRADPTQLQQIVLNLVVNAVDAIEGSGRITLGVDARSVSVEETEAVSWEMASGPYARVTVRDDGTGMTLDVLSHVFDPFFTTKAEGYGTGLGLATVYGIVKQSSGHVFVDSTPGRGTLFEVLLPRVTAAVTEEDAEPTGAPPSPEAVVVLVVEDDPAVRRVARRVLSREGCTVLEASDGREALALADRHDGAIDVVLSDVVMPDMGGVQLLKELQLRHPGLAAVLTSGYTEAEVHSSIREIGAAFVPKPFTPESLMRAVTEALRGDR